MLQIRCFAILILLLWLIAAPLASACRAAEDVPDWAFRAQERDRTGYAEQKTASLYKGQERSVGELAEMMDKFLYGEIFSRGVLTDKQRELITAAVLAYILHLIFRVIYLVFKALKKLRHTVIHTVTPKINRKEIL